MFWFWIIFSIIWVAMLSDCLVSRRVVGAERMVWAMVLVFTGPVGMVAYVLFVWLDAQRGLFRRNAAV